MGSKLNYSAILLTAMFALTRIYAQTPTPAGGNTVVFRDPLCAHVESVPEAPPALQQVAVELAGTFGHGSANASIQFLLTLKNTAPQDVKIIDPLMNFRLQFTTIDNKPIIVPQRVPRDLPKVPLPKNAAVTKDAPYPAPVEFRRIVRGTLASAQKEEVITVLSGGEIQIVFETEPVVMQRVSEALQTETGEAARSFKARAAIGLLAAPPRQGVGGRLLDSDWIFFAL